MTRPWLVLGVLSLLASGLLAVLVTGAKMPAVKHLIDVELVRWCLVVHVNLATLVWFTAVPVGLLHVASRPRGVFASRFAWAAFLVALTGVALLFSVPPQEGVRPILANYIPSLSHPRYGLGIGVYLAGVTLAILTPRAFAADSGQPGFAEIRFGLRVGAVFLLLAVATTALAFRQLLAQPLLAEHRLYELGMWGGGHLIQHAVAVFTLCCWVLFLARGTGRALLSRAELFVVFAWLGAPVFFVPLILFLDATAYEYRRGFTLLMQWGIAPPILFFLFQVLRRSSWRELAPRGPSMAAFLGSAALLLTGFVFGAFIRGPDLRVPGHYHASIGAVTLAFMAVSHLLLAPARGRWLGRAVWTYAIGQGVFAGGMFMAGAFGMARKTYGSENIIAHGGQGAGIVLMAVGGLGALAGGIFFGFAIVPWLRRKARSHA